MLNVGLTMYSQSKKEMEEKILQLEEKTINLESEITSMKNNLTNTTTTVALLAKSNLDLEKQVGDQSTMIQKLIKQNDSLLILFKVKNEHDFIAAPRNEEDSIVYVIQSFYASKKWEDRLSFVLNAELVKQQMKEYYSTYYQPSIVKKNEVFVKGTSIKNNQVFEVNISSSKVVYLKKVNNTFKIDWLATVGYNDIPIKTLKATLSTLPTEIRVYATLGSYYNYNYAGAQSTHWNIYISDNDDTINGCYINKKSVDGKKLYDILKDGKKHQIIVDVVIDSSQDNSADTAVINKLVKEGWSKE